MIDALNAEVSLGTIANVQEAIQWLGYTYLFGECFFEHVRAMSDKSRSANASRAICLR